MKLLNVSMLIISVVLIIVLTHVVNALIEVNFTVTGLNWGAGSVDSGSASATLDSDAGTVIGGNWAVNSGELVIENIGTENVSLSLYSSKDADGLVGGNPSLNSFQWKIAEMESGSCGGITTTSFTDVNTTNPGTRICDVLDFNDVSDSVKVDFKIVIPSDSGLSGLQSVTITAVATGV